MARTARRALHHPATPLGGAPALEESVAAEHGRLPVAFESHQLVTVGRMVAQGLGVSAVPTLCIQQMQELGARCLPLYAPQVQRRVGLLRLSEHKLSTAAQALSDVLLHGTDWRSLALPQDQSTE